MYAYGSELLMRSVLQVSLEPLPFGRHCPHQAGPAGSDLGEGVLQLQLEPAAHLDPQPGLDCGFARPAYPTEPTSGRVPTVTLLICKGIALPGDRAVRRVLQQDLEAGVVQRGQKYVLDLLGFGAGRRGSA